LKGIKPIKIFKKRPKLSEMILKFAGDYINMGETTADRENYLRSAVTAWNIAYFSGSKREELIKTCIKDFKEINNATKEQCRKFEANIRLLIKQKDKHCPDVKVQILDAQINIVDGKERITVASVRETWK